MAKTKNSTKVALTILCYVGLTLFLNSCKDDDTPPNCGCNSETRATIPETANLIGQIAYKTQQDPMDTYYNNHYWITYIKPNCSNCIHHMIICNESILSSNFDDLTSLPTGQSVEVQFSGHLKEICQKKIDIASVTYERITLTSIERQ